MSNYREIYSAVNIAAVIRFIIHSFIFAPVPCIFEKSLFLSYWERWKKEICKYIF